ncbi:hypothetical protein QP986_04155 [Corynebacterium striatum]|uniref:hypothetical protein n=1 Tax=Corynebacterium striatum TaxID=43770 RepID=UPI002549CE58|nr:hypothetical protein [Corynebacterium striatum]MDK8843266.1 hypothetical protein [Corynebacterium striatum]
MTRPTQSKQHWGAGLARGAAQRGGCAEAAGRGGAGAERFGTELAGGKKVRYHQVDRADF